MITEHALKRIKERQIEIDLEMLEYFCQKYNQHDTAIILGKVKFLGEDNLVICIIRDANVITIEFRRTSQHNDANSLNVEEVIAYPCLF